MKIWGLHSRQMSQNLWSWMYLKTIGVGVVSHGEGGEEMRSGSINIYRPSSGRETSQESGPCDQREKCIQESEVSEELREECFKARECPGVS